MALDLTKPCPHDVSEQDVAAQADGLCPLCLAEQVRILRTALEEIVQKGSARGYSRAVLGQIAKQALNAAFARSGASVGALPREKTDGSI